MKFLLFPAMLILVLGISSCGLLRTATQLPGRTLKSLGRTVGFGLEHSEVEGEEADRSEVKFELKAEE